MDCIDNNGFQPPIFIRGIMPRSGTVYLGECLKLHRDVEAYPNEIWEFPHDNHIALIDEYISKVSKSYHAQKFVPELFTKQVGDAWMNYLHSFTVSQQSRVLIKSPTVRHLESVFRYFPSAYLLVIVRDGRDVVASGLKSGFVAPPKFNLRNRHSWRRLVQSSDFRWICRAYGAAGESLLSFEKSACFEANQERILRIKFEDLCSDTESTMRNILAWAGLDPSVYDWRAMREIPVKGSSFLRSDNGEMDFEVGLKKTDSFQPQGRWTGWTRRQMAVFDEEAGAAQRDLGYRCGWK